MKLNQETSPVTISGAVAAPSGFNIAASRQAFKILSSGLYTNKIRAIIRELSCNAYDAHVAAGKVDQPFSIHLPTSFEPFFSVRDKGTGLEYREKGCPTCRGLGKLTIVVNEGTTESECTACQGSGNYDAVKVLYCTYFASNKNDSNLFVGALGLGSKSPFSYTEGFSVTNTYNGWTRVYSCFLNDEGMPAVLLQVETETPDAENGVEIQFPVKQRDVWEFENQAKVALEFFDPQPEINITTLVVSKKEYKLRNAKWGLRKDSEPPRAIQGMVQYGIGDIDQSRLSMEQARLVELPLDLFFNIGDLEVAASRESLSNDDRTVQNVLTVLDTVRDGLVQDIRHQLSFCKTPWEARIMVYNLQNTKGLGRLVTEAFNQGLLTDANPHFQLTQKKLEINQYDYPGVSIQEFSKSGGYNRIQANKSTLTRKEIPTVAEQPNGRVYNIAFSADKDDLFLINDVGFGVEKFVHYMVQHGQSERSIYLINRLHKDVPLEAVVCQGADILAALGNPPMMLVSEIKSQYADVFKQGVSDYVPKPPRTVLKLNESAYAPSYSKGWTRCWDDVTKKPLPEGTKYYIAVKNLEPQVGEFTKIDQLIRFVGSVRDSGQWKFKEGDSLYGIPVWKVKDLDNTWVDFFSYVMNHFLGFMTPEREIKWSLTLEGFSSGMDVVLKKFVTDQVLPQDSPMQEFAERFVEAQRTAKVVTAMKPVIAKAEALKIHTITHKLDFNALWKTVKDQYPLLSHLNTGRWHAEESLISSLKQYIEFMDTTNRQEAALQEEALASLATIDDSKETHAN